MWRLNTWIYVFMNNVFAVLMSSIYQLEVPCHPEQVHIAFGDTTTDIVIMWATKENCTTELMYGLGPWEINTHAEGVMKHFTEKNDNGLHCLHRVELKGLKNFQTYFYRPLSSNISSGPFYFKTPPAGNNWIPEFVVYGDLGVEANTIPILDTEILSGDYTAVLHVGDFAYNLADSNGEISNNTNDERCLSEHGDTFMRLIEGIAAHLPYMTSPGNHEIDDNTFAHYRNRFSMPDTPWPIPINKMWYSMNIGQIHFISYSTEVFFTSEGQHIQTQKSWLMADMKQANDNRAHQPWVIAFGHRPMYCSNTDGDDCTRKSSLVREGLEELFYSYGVDLVIQAHEHSYERLWPSYKGVVLNKNYTNPQAPIQIITGAAGSKHGTDQEKKTENAADWSALRLGTTAFDSYGRLKVYNASHLFWEQISIDGQILDSIWITQENHGPFHPSKLSKEVSQKIEKEKTKEEKEKTTKAGHAPQSTGPNKITETGDTDKEGTVPKIKKFLSNMDNRIVIGVTSGIAVFVIIIIVVLIVRRKRRPKKYRRWDEKVDYGRKFYSSYAHVENNDKDADDFEVDVRDGSLQTSKLLNDDR